MQTRSLLRKKPWLLILLLLGLTSLLPFPLPGRAQTPQTPAPPQVPRPDAQAIVHHLNAAISWYRAVSRTRASGRAVGGQPSDAVYQQNAQRLAAQILQLAFQAARAEAALLPARAKGTNPTSSAPQQQDLSQTLARTSNQISQLQAEVDQLNRQISASAGRKRQSLVARRDNLQGELDLNRAMQAAIQKMINFISQSSGENAAGGLEGTINQLEQSVPEVFGFAGQKTQAASATPAASVTHNAGLIGESLTLFDQLRQVHSLDQLAEQTDGLKGAAAQIREPLRVALRETIQYGQSLAKQPVAPGGPASAPGQPGSDPPPEAAPQGTPQAATPNPAGIRARQQQFQKLTDQFRNLAAPVLPLSQEILLLDQSHANLQEWRGAVVRDSESVLGALLLRVLTVLAALAVVLALSELWRRFTFRYIHEARRRRQFLLLRRFVTGFAVAIVIILGFVSEFSSLATYAGLLTAGIAVSLQAVLLSVAAYFFLIGRYGIRVGDRITVSGVTGDVVDIGLVRLYVMELAGTGVELYPTGRIVVFSNSVLFQATTPLYKQIPGTEYTWHEVSVPIAQGGNVRAVQEKILQAIDSVFARYRGEIERQHQEISRRIDLEIAAPAPEGKLQLSDAGLEFVARYPVGIRQSSAVDDQIARGILEIIEQDAGVKSSVSGLPRIRAAVRG